MSPLAWLSRLIFGAASPAGSDLLDDVNRHARDYLDTLQDDTRPVRMPSAAQIAQAFPPPCPGSLPPSAPPSAPPESPDVPPVTMSVERHPWHQASVHYAPPPTPRPMPIPRTGSGPPPRMSPPPPLPPPPPRPVRPLPPRRR